MESREFEDEIKEEPELKCEEAKEELTPIKCKCGSKRIGFRYQIEGREDTDFGPLICFTCGCSVHGNNKQDTIEMWNKVMG